MRRGRLGIALIGLALAAGCGGQDATKAGGSGPPVKLRLGTADPRGRPATGAIEEFARQVEALSGRRLRIEIAWAKTNDNAPAWDQRVARRVGGGQFDLGMVPARAWDTEGVTSLRALQAPFLIRGDDLARQVAGGKLGRVMLGGLDRAGVVGLALMPEGLRHPVGFGAPVSGPADFEGAVMRVPLSETSFALFRSLGATPRDLTWTEFERGVQAGSVAGAESSFALASTLPGTAVYTGNLTLYPKVNTLVVNRKAYDGLSDEQRKVLREAASRTVQAVRARGPSDREAAAAFCKLGGTVIEATKAELRALERAAAPVYARLAVDPQTRALIEEIRELSAQRSIPPGAAPCQGAGAARRSDDGGSFPNGVYRNSLSKQDLVEAGFPTETDDLADYNGLHTMTFKDGELVDELRSDNPHPPEYGSTYSATGNTVAVCFHGDCSNGFTATWSLRDGVLVFRDIRGADPVDTPVVRAVFAKSLKKIG